jgi:hypothetical protein
VTRFVWEKVAQNEAQSIFVITHTYITFTVEKRSPNIGATSVIFTKVAKVNSQTQSGHPGCIIQGEIALGSSTKGNLLQTLHTFIGELVFTNIYKR